ncbi:hypothetical protein [Pseudomonas chlororaphis]|uniref:hypothetical protein n=1 Tax=Pseudomonas chlororaphis TaxID=587753 RepID=UPI00156B3AD3|nr:hypothetical protein [Pseudomonas chlororaphis]MBM0284598.1 hypothetical protein [Pseudomonas chlororaphis]WDG97705.1 hypothetical protein PUP54_28850 [Pseudomonas chlororaphis]WDH16575.1 hypothetical protein PUP70_00310 [Pseudomonas chlororaphis]WDH62814.1 hypothetical protein PUP71_18770 [Pseudomonas chlororaphis]
MEGYLAVVADSDLFGCLAFLSLALLVTALHRRAQETYLHRVLTFIVLASVVAMFVAGTWYGNSNPA